MGPLEIGTILVLSFIGILLFWFLIVVLLLGGIVFWIWMLIDCLNRRNFVDRNDKVVWVLVLLLTSFFGAVLYYLLIYRKDGKRKK